MQPAEGAGGRIRVQSNIKVWPCHNPDAPDDGAAKVHDYPIADFFLHWVNFLTPPIEAMRAVLFDGEAPGAADTVYTVAAAGVALAFGAFVFSRSDDRIATEV